MKEKDLDLIEKFYNNQLTDVEKSTFESRRAADASFAESVELYEVSKAIIQNNHRERLLADAQSYMDELEPASNRQTSFFLNRKMAIAASVLLLVAAVFLFRHFFAASPTETLFAQHFEIPIASNLRSSATTDDQTWNEAVTAYNSRNYPQAIELMTNLLENEELAFKDRVHFYLGMSHILNDDLESGVTSLKSVSNASSFYQQATWYEALAALKSGNIDSAKILLQNIADSETHYKRKSAETILRTLR